MVVSDRLSRAHLDESKPKIPKTELNQHVHSLISNFPMTDAKLEEFKIETENDSARQTVKKYVLEGWPEKSSTVDSLAQPYFTYRDEIPYAEGPLLKGNCVVVPSSMRKDIKNRIHQGHFGIERCRSRARQAVFRPRMSDEIEDMISRCTTCQEHRSYQPKKKMVSHSATNSPWAKVASDLFEYKKSTYVLVVDYFSNFIDVSKLPPGETKSEDVIKHTKSIYARHRIPEIVISDNDPHYSSDEYKRFAKEWKFFHDTSKSEVP